MYRVVYHRSDNIYPARTHVELTDAITQLKNWSIGPKLEYEIAQSYSGNKVFQIAEGSIGNKVKLVVTSNWAPIAGFLGSGPVINKKATYRLIRQLVISDILKDFTYYNLTDAIDFILKNGTLDSEYRLFQLGTSDGEWVPIAGRLNVDYSYFFDEDEESPYRYMC